MPKKVTLLRVFVASPNDVAEEREALEEVIRELNIVLSRKHGIQLDLVKWETHAYPSFGEDAQSVINEQIADDYDIFIGILWKRFGTPTGRAKSGTIEEFNRAYARFQQNPSQIRVLFYFNESPVAPSEMDPEQLKHIRQFRDELGEKGGLYWTYTDIEEFTSLARLHLSQHVNDFGKTWGQSEESHAERLVLESSQASMKPTQLLQEDDEEEGFLDLIELGTENFEAATDAAIGISSLVEKLGKKMQERTAEMRRLPQPIPAKTAKRISNRAAEDMEHFATRTRTEIPILAETYDTAVNAYARAAELWVDFGSEDKEEIEDALEVVRELKSSLVYARTGIREFRDSIQALPRVTTKFNRAKRNALSVVNELLDEMSTATNLTTEVEKTMMRIIAEGE